MRLLKMLYEGLSNCPKVILYTEPPKLHKYAPLMSFNIKGMKSDDVAAYFDKRGVALRAGLH